MCRVELRQFLTRVVLQKVERSGDPDVFAGLAGGLYTYFTQFIVPDSFGFIVSVMLMAMVVIGGTGSTLGVVAAAIILTLLPEFFRFMNEYRLLVFGGLLVLVVRFAPGGIAGIGRSAIARVCGR